MLITFDANGRALTPDRLKALDRWLGEALRLDLASLAPPGERGDTEPALTGAFAARLAVLIPLLLELARIPVFELQGSPSIKEDRARPGTWIVRLRVPDVGLIPSRVYQYVAKFAFELCQGLCRTEISADSRRRLFDAIDAKIVKNLQRLIPGGKSTIPVLRVAHDLGIPYMHLGGGVYQLGWGSKARLMERSSSELDSAIGVRLSHDKAATASLLKLAGLPAPVHAMVGNSSDAVAASKKLGFPLVVKPADGDRGEGVTVDIGDPPGLSDAFDLALRISRSKRVLVERQVAGVCHRVFVANGKLLYGVKRLPMSIGGDGRHTVSELVAAELARQQGLPPWQRSEVQAIDDLAIAAMAREGWTPESVPPEGILVPLRRIESTAWGGVDEEVTDRIHPENLAICLRAAGLFGLDVAGIDIITTDISAPWFRTGAIINEVNFAPLLGGGEISRRHIPAFFGGFIDGDGKIPVERFEGRHADRRALEKQLEYAKQGIRCFVTSASRTVSHDQQPVVMPLTHLDDRVRALLCRRDVDALLIVEN